jgi:hypothetical protein
MCNPLDIVDQMHPHQQDGEQPLEPNASAYWGRRPSVAADLAPALHRGLHVSLPSLTYLPAEYGRPAAHG